MIGRSPGVVRGPPALLFGLAYRMLGSAAEAEDIVQEAWLRGRPSAREECARSRRSSSTVVTRLCLIASRARGRTARSTSARGCPSRCARTRRWNRGVDLAGVPGAAREPVAPERAVYLLHEVFGYSHAEVAAMVGKEESACRQILHRAPRAHPVRGGRASLPPRRPMRGW